jgi:solute carrier family 25 protein 39/40
MVQIAQKEGIVNLWRGLTPALVGSLPSTVLYYTGYESLRDILLFHTQSQYSPMFAGAIARTFVVGLISPLELFRTRMQADSVQLSVIMKDIRVLVKVKAINSE